MDLLHVRYRRNISESKYPPYPHLAFYKFMNKDAVEITLPPVFCRESLAGYLWGQNNYKKFITLERTLIAIRYSRISRYTG